MPALKKLLVLCMLPSASIYAQEYTMAAIKAKADKALHSLVNEQIFSHCTMNKHGYFSYKDSKGEVQWAELQDAQAAKGTPLKTGVYYTLDYKYPQCHLYDSISGRIFLEFNAKWELTNTPDLNFIPEFVMKNEPCHFISKQEAMQIATSNNKKVDPHTQAGINYSDSGRLFTWHLFHIPSEEERAANTLTLEEARSTPQKSFKEAMSSDIFINAETGELLDPKTYFNTRRHTTITRVSED